MARVWNHVTVIGCGLIGGSFALALKRSGAVARISGWDVSARSLDEALACGAIDDVDDSFAGEKISPADLIYLAMPVDEIIRFFHERGSLVKTGAIVTDAGSTKAEICRAAREYLPAGRHFVGGHPIAGSHRAGISHARAELFNDAPYVLMRDNEQSDGDALSAVEELIKQTGARVELMTAEEHDRAMAFVSHLPQLMSNALAAAVTGQSNADELERLSGNGYRDMTRLAESSWSIWRDILLTNDANIAAALDLFIEKLVSVRDELRERDEGSELKDTHALFR
ncbi:MAG: prephenate dehydrogenase/arogenate dehydrogenase family protein [Pyrinomonadaceae bacterium]